MERTKAYYTGRTWGFEACGRYIVGGKQERAEVRRLFDRTADSFNPFWLGAYDGFQERAEARAHAITIGMAPRTIAPRTIAPRKLISFLQHRRSA